MAFNILYQHQPEDKILAIKAASATHTPFYTHPDQSEVLVLRFKNRTHADTYADKYLELLNKDKPYAQYTSIFMLPYIEKAYKGRSRPLHYHKEAEAGYNEGVEHAKQKLPHQPEPAEHLITDPHAKSVFTRFYNQGYCSVYPSVKNPSQPRGPIIKDKPFKPKDYDDAPDNRWERVDPPAFDPFRYE